MRKIGAIAVILATVISCLISCGTEDCEELGTGWSQYAQTRDVSDRDAEYVEMCVRNYGKVIILIDRTSAPITADNFLTLVKEGFYDGLTFHRVINDFMIQGGDPKGDGTGESGKTIKGEFSVNGYYNDISHYAGVISMARGEDMNSASCQFFICNSDARSSLDGRYAAFGYVVMGMSVIERITEEVFPKTALYEYYNNFGSHPVYQVPYHYLWQYYGNGAIEKNEDKPVIEHIKVLENYTPDFDYSER